MILKAGGESCCLGWVLPGFWLVAAARCVMFPSETSAYGDSAHLGLCPVSKSIFQPGPGTIISPPTYRIPVAFPYPLPTAHLPPLVPASLPQSSRCTVKISALETKLGIAQYISVFLLPIGASLSFLILLRNVWG